MPGASQFEKFVLLFGFLGILSLPLLNDCMRLWEFEKMDENRFFKSSVDIDFSHLDPFPNQYNEFFDDNFSFRRPLLDLYHGLQFDLLKVSPHRDRMFIGADQWYFLNDKAMEVYQGKWDFSQQQLDYFITEWEKRKAFLEARDIPVIWVIAPIKHHVYEDKIPMLMKARRGAPRGQVLANALNEKFPGLVYYPLEDFRSQTPQFKWYYQLDNHWNLHAGYYVSGKVINSLKKQKPELSIPSLHEYRWKVEKIQYGIHYKLIGVPDIYENDIVPLDEDIQSHAWKIHGFPVPEEFRQKTWYEWVHVNFKLNTGTKALVIRDSYGTQTTQFLPECFSETMFIWDNWKYKLNEEIIEEYKPDVLIYISSENSLENMIEDYPDDERPS